MDGKRVGLLKPDSAKTKKCLYLPSSETVTCFSIKKKRALIDEHLSGHFIHEYRRRCEDIHKSNKYFDVTPVLESGLDLLVSES
jgi:hypothetical protein